MMFIDGLFIGLPIGFMLGLMMFTWDNRKPTRYKARTSHLEAFGIV